MNEFKIGQRVLYRPANAFKIGGQYVVTRLLPQAHYVIRSQDDPERAYTAVASELRKAPNAAMGFE
jgi:hypothetical protein